MANFQDSFLSGGNIEFIEALYARYLEDPTTVDASWRDLFSQVGRDGKPIYVNGAPAPQATKQGPPPEHANGSAANAAEGPARTLESMGLQARVDQTVWAFRLRGHLLAQLDPLGFPRPQLDHVADLGMVSDSHFSAAELEERVDSANVVDENPIQLKELLARLKQVYCHHIGVEYAHLLDSARRRWLGNRVERTGNKTDFTVEEQRRILTKLTYAEVFESFLHVKYQGAKRFSIDGGEALVPMMDAFLEVGAALGMNEVVIGMAHRGRLNVLTNILGKKPDQIFSEFDGPTDFKQYLNRGDVKYHQGFSSDYTTQAGKQVHLSLAFNPSHLEVVYPVVEGRTRAKQDRLVGPSRGNIVPLVIHGDAAFSGQGLVAETLNLSQLKGYHTGGTVHIVINNQVGYTTEAEQGRSSLYCTAISQIVDIPVFHVNGDDPEACVHVMKVATEYRQTFHTDVVIDLVCYRRYGHNEGDEPAFTQPLMYEKIRAQPTVRTLYSQELDKAGRIAATEAEAIKQRCHQEFLEAHARAKAKSSFQEPSFNQGIWAGYVGGFDKDAPQVETGLPAEKLKALLTQITTLPPGFTAHPNLMREGKSKGLIPGRLAMARGELPLDWGAAEALAFASLLSEGYSLRLTGQDTERGTFAHRHAVLHDYKTGEKLIPLAQLAKHPRACLILNSPLSEMGCLGFEFGYSLDCPDGLVAWEAQFGDFANNAQVIIDQFIAAAEDKWKRLSALTLLLPHGYEGSGPEHSSARLERFLELCGEDNLQVCYPTTPAQIFHLLRRQVLRPLRKPLVVMTPKSLLRSVSSSLEELTRGQFQRLIPDDPKAIDPKKVTRLLLCSGKVCYDLLAGREKSKDPTIGLARIEQLYPFPQAELSALLAQMPKLTELYWVQEEPKNNGPWTFMIQYLQSLISDLPSRPRFGFIGRVESASPATGFLHTHNYEQQLIVEEAIARGQSNGR